MRGFWFKRGRRRVIRRSAAALAILSSIGVLSHLIPADGDRFYSGLLIGEASARKSFRGFRERQPDQRPPDRQPDTKQADPAKSDPRRPDTKQSDRKQKNPGDARSSRHRGPPRSHEAEQRDAATDRQRDDLKRGAAAQQKKVDDVHASTAAHKHDQKQHSPQPAAAKNDTKASDDIPPGGRGRHSDRGDGPSDRDRHSDRGDRYTDRDRGHERGDRKADRDRTLIEAIVTRIGTAIEVAGKQTVTAPPTVMTVTRIATAAIETTTIAVVIATKATVMETMIAATAMGTATATRTAAIAIKVSTAENMRTCAKSSRADPSRRKRRKRRPRLCLRQHHLRLPRRSQAARDKPPFRTSQTLCLPLPWSRPPHRRSCPLLPATTPAFDSSGMSKLGGPQQPKQVNEGGSGGGRFTRKDDDDDERNGEIVNAIRSGGRGGRADLGLNPLVGLPPVGSYNPRQVLAVNLSEAGQKRAVDLKYTVGRTYSGPSHGSDDNHAGDSSRDQCRKQHQQIREGDTGQRIHPEPPLCSLSSRSFRQRVGDPAEARPWLRPGSLLCRRLDQLAAAAGELRARREDRYHRYRCRPKPSCHSQG